MGGSSQMVQVTVYDSSAVVPRHLDYLEARNLRPGSIKQRRRLLQRVCRFTGGHVISVTAEQLTQYLSRPGRCPDTRRSELSHLRSFYRWAIREGLLTTDPTVGIETPKVPCRLPRPMPDEHV